MHVIKLLVSLNVIIILHVKASSMVQGIRIYAPTERGVRSENFMNDIAIKDSDFEGRVSIGLRLPNN